VQRNHILKKLIDTQWTIDKKSGAAKVLDIKPSTLRDIMKKSVKRFKINFTVFRVFNVYILYQDTVYR